jgi:hypothetical protein
LNNLFIMGLHCNAGATAINTLNYTFCSAIWGFILLVIMWAGSLFRDFRHATLMGLVSAGTMFVSYLIVVIGHSVQGTPNGYIEGVTDASWSVWAPPGTTFVQGVSALLNIAYTFIGQALIPSFIGDMARPQDFPKALYSSMAAELILFSTCGAIVYAHTGVGLTTAPAYGSLIEKYAKPAAALVLPTVIIVGILYSLVTSRAIMFQIFPEKSIHRQQHTVRGWSVWVAIVTGTWIIAFIIGESIPFFSDLLSLICSLFDSWFGFLLIAGCFFQLYWRKKRERTFIDHVEVGINVLMLVVGLFLLGAGTYASVQSIINSYNIGAIKTPFTCVNTGFTFTR